MANTLKRKELKRTVRALIGLVEKDLHEIADSVVQIDERLADEHALGIKRQEIAAARYLAFDERLSALERGNNNDHSKGV